LGFEVYTNNQCIYINKSIGILIIIYVNNMLIIGKDKAKIKALKKSLIRRFKIEDLGPTKYFIGVRIT
jgi:ribosomal protein S3